MRYVIVVVGLIAVAVLAGMWQLSMQSTPANTVYGKAAIGGDFSLTDQHGEAFTQDNLKGHYSLLYFGFTHCPDICPTGLSTITNAMDELGTQADALTPIFVTVDPERDTQEVMAEYVANFHPRLVGLTGTAEQVKTIADAYKVYYSKSEQEGSAMGYTVDHSGYMYLMGKDGEYVAHFPHDISAKDLTAQLKQLIKP